MAYSSDFADAQYQYTDIQSDILTQPEKSNQPPTDISWSKNETSDLSSTTHSSKEGKVRELELKLNSDLKKLKIRDATMLSKTIQQTSEKIDMYEKEGKTEDVEKELEKLTDLKALRNLLDQITDLKKSVVSCLQENDALKLHEFEQKLSSGFAKLKLRDVGMLQEKIKKTQERITEYEEEERTEDVEKESKYLLELQELEKISNEIINLKISTTSFSLNNCEANRRELEQKLNNGLAKVKIRDVGMLQEKIKKTQERIREYEEEERTEDVANESKYLLELQELQKVSDEMSNLKSSATSFSTNDCEVQYRKLEQNLNSGLAKVKIRDVRMLQEKIKKTQERITEYEEEERTEDVEKESKYLLELQELEKISNEIINLKISTASFSLNNCEANRRELEQKLNNGLAKVKIRDVRMLQEKIKKTQERITEYEEEERTEDVEKESKYLLELQELEKISNEIINLKISTTSFSLNNCEANRRELEQKLNNGLAKVKIRDVGMLQEKIKKTQERIREYEEEERTEDVANESKYLLELQELQKVSDEMSNLKSSATSFSTNDCEVQYRKLEQNLNSGLAKVKIRDVRMLQEKIKKTQERITEYEEEERTEDVEKESKYLLELQELEKISNEIINLKISTASFSLNNCEANRRELEQKLNNGLAKVKIRDVRMLQEKIKKTQERITEYEEEERTEDVEKESKYLLELQELEKISNEIINLKISTASFSLNNCEANRRELEQKLNNGLAKVKIRDVRMLQEKIKKTQERITEYEEEERTEDVETESKYLLELQELEKISNEIINLKISTASFSLNNCEANRRELEQKLNNGLANVKIRDVGMLQEKIKKTQERIREYEEEERTEDVEKESKYLLELQELQRLSVEICKLPIVSPVPPIDEPSIRLTESERSVDNDVVTRAERNKKVSYLNNAHDDLTGMPSCTVKTIMKLLGHFEQRLLGDFKSLQEEDLDLCFKKLQEEDLGLSFKELQDQLKKEELLSENTRTILRDLEIHKASDNCSFIVRCLDELLKKIRSLNVPEIQRLVSKAEEAAELIRDQEIILLVGETGAGKSTTIQFLSGATMKATQVEIAPGKFLEHITAVGSMKNSVLSDINSSPRSKSETRYIASVRVELQNVLGPQQKGFITLCDTPGIGDTAGAEVDIANGIGVIEALKGTKSVILFILSSYKSLGDRGQGIQRLAHLLINMINGIEKRLDSILYGFTKYPEKTNVNHVLTDIKNSKVEEDALLKSDTVFSTVLEDMIEKTEDGAFKIDPIHEKPKDLIKVLKKMKGIQFPADVFRFSMSEETRATIDNHVQKDKLSIICAMKQKDHDLVLYYLKDLKILKDLLKQSEIRDAYDDSIRFISESISQYSSETMKKFNRALASQDGLEEKDIDDYKISIKYLDKAQILKEHLDTFLLSSEALVQNIISELHERKRILKDEDLYSPLIVIYLDNLCLLKKSFKELETDYNNSCKEFEKRFEELMQSTHELIRTNKFKEIAEIILKVSKSVDNLEKHLHEQLNEKYSDIFKLLLQHLNSFSAEADPLLAKIRLSNDNVDVLKKNIEILRLAKDNAALQERISTYVEMLKKKSEVSEKHSIDHVSKDLNAIYDEFIGKIVKYFDEIDLRIKDLFDRNGDQTLEHIEKLISDMEALRTIPELESKTAATYYRTVENVRSHMQQLQTDAEKLLTDIDQQSGVVNYRHLARSLSRLKNAEWINRVSPGTYDTLMRRITEELIQYVSQLEEELMKIDFSLKCPENVSGAYNIVEKVESMRDLQRSIPELGKHTNNILQRFLQCTQNAFDRIQKTFNLQDKDVYKIKQELKDLEEIRREYNNLHPARIYLQKQEYSDINMLDREIGELKTKQQADQKIAEAEQKVMDSELNNLDSVIREYMVLSASDTNKGLLGKFSDMIGRNSQRQTTQAEDYLKKLGYSSIEEVYEKVTTAKSICRNKLQHIQDQNTGLSTSLRRLESIKNEHDSLLVTRNSPSNEEMNFIHEKGFGSLELLDQTIQEKAKVVAERGKNKQSYFFNDRLDGSTANNALEYINQCEKIGHDRVRENVADTNEILKKYLNEYGNFLHQEISSKFNFVCNIAVEGGPFQYSQDLEMCLRELSSLNKFSLVFKCIDGTEKEEHWQQEFLKCLQDLSNKLEEYKGPGQTKELRDQLIIVHALCSVDRFCTPVFANNGFGTLYRQFKGEISTETKLAYRTVLDNISKGDYANAAIALSDITDNPLIARDKAQIQHDLQSSLNKLMKGTRSIANWLDGKIEREEDNRDQIREIKENIEKCRIALNKHIIMELLDERTRNNLQSFDNEIDEILSRIVLKGLRSIEAFMDADSFSEAEQGVENLSRVQRELTGYCTSEEVTKKSEQLSTRLSGIVSEILERNDFADVNRYSVNPPKDILVKLKMVAAHGSARYMQAYTSMLGKIRQTISLAIEKARVAPLNERSVKIRSLNYALYFLPEDLRIEYKLQIDELSKFIVEEEKSCKQDLEASLTNLDEDEHAITKLGTLAQRYKTQNMCEFSDILREQILKKLHTYRTNIQNSLDKQDIKTALDVIKKVFLYDEYIGSYIPEIKALCTSVSALTINGFLSCCETLANISSIEKSQIVEKTFSDMLVYLNFSSTVDKNGEEFFSIDVLKDAEQKFQTMYRYLDENSKKFQMALNNTNVIELNKVILIAKKWENLLKNISDCQSKHSLIQKLKEQVKDIILYNDMISELEKLINQINTQSTVELITDETTKFEAKREELFKNIMIAIDTLKEIKSKLKDILSSTVNLDKYEDDLKMKVERISSQITVKASKEELSTRDADEFRMCYNHLLSFEKHVRISGIDVKKVLNSAKEKILEKVTSLRREIVASGSDAGKVSENLMKIKFLAENLSMFDSDINAEINDSLRIYKEKQGHKGISLLTAELDNSDIGGRLISEHSHLSGEDWRKRREKMQKQDDLEYLLKELTGDNIAKGVLRSRYETFKKKYDDLVKTNLKLLSQSTTQEPDLGALIAEIKHLVGEVSQTPNSVIWKPSFKDDIPVLLAHIFAVWTLKNTQHYNTMRGIESAKAYLLMPHVGQVIAIFRLLGLGYEEYKKIPIINVSYNTRISDDLVNNLVQVGTGEGKSVVMAITACVFALTGADVNCSCYSEVLSMRDKNDFTSVFRALGIEECIEYGTFNKLCEQLLNEQCNVREKVRNTIVTNQSALAAADTSVRIRPKVLLIDEVDVFLSDKYYGGVYIPSVYLKDPSIKELLDSIWQNKSLKTLKSVKALPAYITCATQYSNWIFLFDEAIKDMLAAVQSYESSTYIVQNDRIVYVEGESIVDNVVRGYDTIWAYYHENQKGEISQSSLEANVGIIINCGTFSYAEMPHDFAFIGGVTGTLETLAIPEKEILKRVYSVDKSTFMPSVFGSSNRTYNSQNDVRAVKESEYFMEIRGEIDAVGNVSRAILVFFESEEKLIAFYDSSALSSIKQDVQIITETVSVKERELCTKRAATISKVTLLTRTFGRGTDFICRNQQLLLNGGLHVLQTFFSEELSEEYQIMGRGARQGDKGSYRMILLDEDLEWVLGSAWKEDLPKIIGTKIYKSLNEARNARYESKCGAKEVGIKQCKRDHKASKDFMTALLTGDMGRIKMFLSEQNKGANLIATSSRTVLLMDATGSMSSLLSAAKETVCTMFERASTVLQEKGLPNDEFQMQFAIYRNYNSKESQILQVSPWNTKGSSLRAFMNTIDAEGGWGNEAIEIGLWHAVKESEMPDSISQVILIADAPANSQAEVGQKRARFGEAYWKATKFDKPTYYATELQKLKDQEIPIHAFYLTPNAKEKFEEIARETGGRCEMLNINSLQGAEMLTHLVTEEILRKIVDDDQGDAIVALYRTKYVKTTFTC